MTSMGINLEKSLWEIYLAESIEVILDICSTAAVSWGCSCRSYHFMNTLGKSDVVDHQYSYDRPASQWLSIYDDMNPRMDNIIPAHIMTTGKPMLWSKAASETAENVQERNFITALRSRGFGDDGLGLPLFGPAGRNAYSAYGLDSNQKIKLGQLIQNLWALSTLAHLRILEILDTQNEATIALSKREKEVLIWLGRGKSNKEIARSLGISGDTVDTYVRRTYKKLHAKGRIEAIIRAIQLGIISV